MHEITLSEKAYDKLLAKIDAVNTVRDAHAGTYTVTLTYLPTEVEAAVLKSGGTITQLD